MIFLSVSFYSDVHYLNIALFRGNGVYLEFAERLDERCQLLEAKVSHIKAGITLQQDISHLAERCPAVIIGDLADN